MSTYNRGALLADAMQSVLQQHDRSEPRFELIVVDNNSTDETRAVIDRLAANDPRVRYVFESCQGLSFARNAGIQAARAQLIAFTDDDVRAEPDWIASVVRAFEEFPDVDAVGGRVLPVWPSPPPAWLTHDHWAPLAIVDYGDAPIVASEARPICLLGANVAFRRSVFERVGLFATGLQRVKDGIGSLEDHEFLLRLFAAGGRGLYDPRVVVHAEIQPNRLQRAYHRRWHRGHGHFFALLRARDMESTGTGTLLGVPAHLYRQAFADTVGWVRAAAAGRSARAFQHVVRLRFFNGFLQTRMREHRRTALRERRGELRNLLRGAASRLLPQRGPRIPLGRSSQ